jgi:ADP-heptose:LPS heptosyltransferase
MTILIIKLGATGDVIRTTPLLRVLSGEIHLLTDDRNALLLDGLEQIALTIRWSGKNSLHGRHYDLVINLEDSFAAAHLLRRFTFDELFGAYLDGNGNLTYTDSSREWFDPSLISRFGKERADQLKLRNRRTYQEMIFTGLGYTFKGEPYLLPNPIPTGLVGGVALAPHSGAVWLMKNWAYYDGLKNYLEKKGLVVNVLPTRSSLLEHVADVQNHRYLVSGDSLPMHIALGSRITCTTIFICTSPWEIHDYGLQRKIVSPKLEHYFYRRDFDENATTSIPLDEVCDAVSDHMTAGSHELAVASMGTKGMGSTSPHYPSPGESQDR